MANFKKGMAVVIYDDEHYGMEGIIAETNYDGEADLYEIHVCKTGEDVILAEDEFEVQKAKENLKDLLFSMAEELGWTVREESTEKTFELEIGKTSDAGEDFWFSVSADSAEGIAEEVERYYEGFDPEEHAANCYGTRGAPGLRALLADADSIDEMLRELAVGLGDVVENYYLEGANEDA